MGGGHHPLRNHHNVHFDRNVHFGDDTADHEWHYKAFLKSNQVASNENKCHHRGNSESRRLQQKSKGYSHHYQEPPTLSSTSSSNNQRCNTAEDQIFSPFNELDGLYVFH